MGLPARMMNIILTFLTNRKIFGYHNGRLIGERSTSIGLPQGSVLSPLLYNIYSAGIHRNMELDVKILSYADDIVIFYRNKSVASICLKLNYNFSIIGQNLQAHDLLIAPQKTKFCIFAKFSRFRTLNRLYNKIKQPIVYLNQRINISPKAVFLGITFDHSLSWKPHITSLLNICNKRLNILKAITGIKWGSHPLTILSVYRGLIRSILDYGGLALYDLPPGRTIQLDRVQYAALRCVLGFMRTTPTNVLLDQNAEWPLVIRRLFLVTKITLSGLIELTPNFSHEMKNSVLLESDCTNVNPGDSLDAPSISTILRSRKSSLLSSSYQEIHNLEPPRYQGHLNFPVANRFMDISTDIIAFSELSKFRKKVGNFYYCKHKKISVSGMNRRAAAILDHKNLNCIIYTDGSVMPDGKAGFGIFSPTHNIKASVPCSHSRVIMHVEAEAIIYAIDLAIELRSNKVGILSDSRSIISNVSNLNISKRTSYLCHKIRDKLISASQLDIHITLIWIPGHCGFIGNETADQLAKSAAFSSHDTCHTNIYCGDFIANIKHDFQKLAHAYLEEQFKYKGRRYRKNIPNLSNSPWYKQYKFSKRDAISLIARIKSYHVSTSTHLIDKNIINDETCECGVSSRNWQHILFNCNKHIQASNNLITNLIKMDFSPWDDIFSRAFTKDLNIFTIIAKFLKQTNQII
ncbi:uncharacterized protein LOC116846151 [Odontomachus brunneus]|uniref:uncharacterized protein LOC116846151 n=1 Tax=Odontomachus brunneus TaxID=486640 RepID=UPI0013F1DB16|nr:uncharacterized protein LOC116846151 [Odontomachus brunneus]